MRVMHYFGYILFRTYLKIIKLVLLESRLNKLSRKKKKRITRNEGQM